MSQKKFILWSILLIVISSTLTFALSNLIGIQFNQKVIISQNEYETLQSIEERYSKAERLREYIKKNYYQEVEDQTLNDGVLHGIFNALDDPYSTYLNQKEFKDFMEQSSGEYGGIGIIVTASDDNYITIVSPIEDTPGERAKLKSGDKIIKVNGEAVSGNKMDEAVDMMKGEPGTDVELTILRDDEQFNIKITRENIELKTVKSRVIEDNIGVIRISMFDENVAKNFKTHLNKLLDQNIESLIIDLRNNPGGSLDEVVDIADELLGKQVIVYTKEKDGTKEYYNSDATKVDLPIAVLVNEGSASASEILAGAVKDTDAGELIGTTTFGKGLVQTVRYLNDDTGIKLTTAQYFTPDGNYIHDKGIKPDYVVELPESFYELSERNDADDTQLQKAIEILKKK